MTSPVGAATAETVYDASQPGVANLSSVGAEAYAYSELGDEMTLAGSARTLTSVAVTMSSWACESGTWSSHNCLSGRSTYNVPITLNIYNQSSSQDDGTVRPGELLGTVTQTFGLPYRPSADLKHCTGDDLGKWYDKKSKECYNGKAATVSFALKSLKLRLPNTVVLGLSYDTTHYGPNPIGESAGCFGTVQGCFYDALNVGLSPAVTTGSKPHPGTLFQNTSYAGNLCDGTPATGVFNLDSPTNPCWNGYNPAFKIVAK